VSTIRIRDMSDPLPKMPSDGEASLSEASLGRFINSFTSPRPESLDAAAAAAILGIEPAVVAQLEWRGLDPHGGGRWTRWTVERLGAILAREAAEPLGDRDWLEPSALFGRMTFSNATPEQVLQHWARLGIRMRHEDEGVWRRVAAVCCFDVCRLRGVDPGNGRAQHYVNVSRRIAAAVDAELAPARGEPC
jgi:hypothetical protein